MFKTMTNQVSKRIKELRTSLNMNQTDFSHKIDLSTSLISKIEGGDIEPSAKVLKRISEIYGVDVNWLLKGEGIMRVNMQVDKKAIDPWKDEAYSRLKADLEYLKGKYDQLFEAFLKGNLGKYKSLVLTGLPQSNRTRARA